MVTIPTFVFFSFFPSLPFQASASFLFPSLIVSPEFKIALERALRFESPFPFFPTGFRSLLSFFLFYCDRKDWRAKTRPPNFVVPSFFPSSEWSP